MILDIVPKAVYDVYNTICTLHGENQPMAEKKELGSVFKEANYIYLQAN